MVLSRISTKVLGAVTIGGAVATASYGLYVNRSLVKSYAGQPYYQDAIRVTRRNPGARKMLGEKIVDGGRTRDRENGLLVLVQNIFIHEHFRSYRSLDRKLN